MDNDSRIKGLIRLIFLRFLENGGELEEDDEILRELSYEGYTDEEIEFVITWINALIEKSILIERDEVLYDLDSINTSFIRPLHPEEREKLTEKAQGLIYWLTSTGQLSPQEREDILDIISYINGDVSSEMVFSILDTLLLAKENSDDTSFRHYN